jgi:hypothetical protein
VADDDFLNPQGLYASLDFLRHHRDYAAAHGYNISIYLKNQPPYYRAGQYLYPWLTSTEDENPLERLINFFYDYSDLTYAVHRTALLKTVMVEVVKYCQPEYFVFQEFLINALTTLQGKIKVLDEFYLARQMDQLTYQAPIWDRALFQPPFIAQVEQFKACLVAKSRFTEESDETLEALAEYCFMAFLTRMYLFSKRYHIQGLRLAKGQTKPRVQKPQIYVPGQSHQDCYAIRYNQKNLWGIVKEVCDDFKRVVMERLLYYRYNLPQKYDVLKPLEHFCVIQNNKYQHVLSFIEGWQEETLLHQETLEQETLH